MLPFVRVGPLLIQVSGLALLSGIWVAINFIEREAIRLRLPVSTISNLIMYGLLGGLVGARLIYALEHLGAYIAAPLSLFALSPTALDGVGGLLIGGAVSVTYGRAARLPLRSTLDALAPGIAVFVVAVGVANLLSGNGYGVPLRAPWAIYLWGDYRHPTQIYEIVLGLTVLLIWKLGLPGSQAPGVRFWQVVGLSTGTRLFTEAFHAGSLITLGGFRLGQLLALLLLGVSLYVGRLWSAPGAPAASHEKARRAPVTGGVEVGSARRKRGQPKHPPPPKR